MGAPLYPSLYQINTRVWLTALSETLDRRATLDDIPDTALDRLAGSPAAFARIPAAIRFARERHAARLSRCSTH